MELPQNTWFKQMSLTIRLIWFHFHGPSHQARAREGMAPDLLSTASPGMEGHMATAEQSDA